MTTVRTDSPGSFVSNAAARAAAEADTSSQEGIEMKPISSTTTASRSAHHIIDIEDDTRPTTWNRNTFQDIESLHPQDSVQTDGVRNDNIARAHGLTGEKQDAFNEMCRQIDEMHNRCVLAPASYMDPTFRGYVANVLAGVAANVTTWAVPTGVGSVLSQLRSPAGQDKMAECIASYLKDSNFTSGIKEAVAASLANAPAGTERTFHGPGGVFASTLIVFSIAAICSVISEPLAQMTRRAAGGANYEFGIAGDGRAPFSPVRSQIGAAANNLAYLSGYAVCRAFLEQLFRESMSTTPGMGTRFAAGAASSLTAAAMTHTVLQAVLFAAAFVTLKANGVPHAYELGDVGRSRTIRPGVLLKQQPEQKQLLDNQEKRSIALNSTATIGSGLLGAAAAAVFSTLLELGGIGGSTDFVPDGNGTNGTFGINGTAQNSHLTDRELMLSPGLTTLVPFAGYLLLTTALRMLYQHTCRHPAGNANHFDIGASKLAVKDLRQCHLLAYEQMLDTMLRQNTVRIHQTGIAHVINDLPVTTAIATQALQEVDGVIRNVQNIPVASPNNDTRRAAERARTTLLGHLNVIRHVLHQLQEGIAQGVMPHDLVRTQNNLTKLVRELPHQALQIAMSDTSMGAEFDLDSFSAELTQAVLPLSLAGRTKHQANGLDSIYKSIGLNNKSPAHSQVSRLVSHEPPQQVVASLANLQPDIRQNLVSKFEQWLASRPPGAIGHDQISALFLLQALRDPPTPPAQQQDADALVTRLLQVHQDEGDSFLLRDQLKQELTRQLDSGAVTLETLDDAIARLVPDDQETQGTLHQLQMALRQWLPDAQTGDVSADDWVRAYKGDVSGWPIPYRNMISAAASIHLYPAGADEALQLMMANPILKKDMHFHPTNYGKTVTDLVKMYDMMLENGVLATNLAGIPSGVQKCCDEAKYYSVTHNKLSYINPDHALYYQWKDLSLEQQGAMILSWTGFDPNDPWSLPLDMAELQREYGTAFPTAGEFTLNKEGGINEKNPSKPDVGGEGPRAALRELQDRGVAAIIHADSHTATGTRHADALLLIEIVAERFGCQVLGEVTPLELNVRRALGADAVGMPAAVLEVVWAHFGGIGKFVKESVRHTHFLDEVLSGRGLKPHIDKFLDSRGIHDEAERATIAQQVTLRFREHFSIDGSWDVVNQHVYANISDQLRRLARDNQADPQCSRNLETLAHAFRAYCEQYRIFTQVGAAADKAEDIKQPEQSAALLAAARRQFEKTRMVLAVAMAQMGEICQHGPTRQALQEAMAHHGPEKRNNWLYVLAAYHGRIEFGTDSLTPLAKAHGKEAYALNVQALDMLFRLLNAMETGDPLIEGDIVQDIARRNFDKVIQAPSLLARRQLFSRYEQRKPAVASTTANTNDGGPTLRL